MKVLITGGTGFIGSRLGLRCLRLGWHVRVLGQENTAAEAENGRLLAREGAEVILASVTDRRQVVQAVQGVDTVFHLAAAQHEAGVADERFREVNVAGTDHVRAASLAAGVRRLVHGSTIGVYGSARHGVLDEESPPCPDNIYGVTKLDAERLVLASADRLPTVVVRISETYGPGDRRLLKLFRAIRGRVFVPVGDGGNIHHPIYIEDLVDGLLLAASAESAPGQVILLAGPETLTTRDMTEVVARQLGATLRRIQVPVGPTLRVAALVEATSRRMGVRPPLHRRRLDFFTKSFAFSTQRSKDILGFVPRVGFARGVAETLEWYRAHGDLPAAPEAGGHPATPRSSSMVRKVELTAKIEPFDSFWEAPANIDKGYDSFAQFYRRNYLAHVPPDRQSRILVVSCGPGYFVNLLRREGYAQVRGIDSDTEKIAYARARQLPCETAEAFPFLGEHRDAFDVIFAEQELNHLTKEEIVGFLGLCWNALRPGGTLIVHSLNGANPITGAEALAQNFDHYNTFTEYAFRQVLDHAGFTDTRVIPLKLYVFYTNPLNYVLMLIEFLYTVFFRFSFLLYGKSNRLFTKKIGAVCRKPLTASVGGESAA
jgi:nucleoside-diphosphate-sugar epimerase/trans-aconitate methyltransferase